MKRCWMLIVCGALLWGGFVPETAALEVPGETIGEKSAETEKKAEPVKEEHRFAGGGGRGRLWIQEAV